MPPSTFEAGLRGLMTLVWHPRIRSAIVYPPATQDGILLAWDRVLLADISGLVLQVLAAIPLGVQMGLKAGVKDSKTWFHSHRAGTNSSTLLVFFFRWQYAMPGTGELRLEIASGWSSVMECAELEIKVPMSKELSPRSFCGSFA